MRPRYKTVRVTQEEGKRLNLSSFPSAGPFPNITGMKQNYWGIDALCVQCGAYVYWVDEITYQNCGGVICSN